MEKVTIVDKVIGISVFEASAKRRLSKFSSNRTSRNIRIACTEVEKYNVEI